MRYNITDCILLGICVTVCTSALTVIFSEFAFSLFSRDAAVIELGSRIGFVTFPFYFLYVFLECYASSIRGAGKAMPTMVITIANMCLFRVAVLAALLHIFHTVTGIALVYPITWVTTSASMYAYYRFGKWESDL